MEPQKVEMGPTNAEELEAFSSFSSQSHSAASRLPLELMVEQR